MECNKDEAVRAKEVAEKKLLERDISGARKLALKAQNLFPNLEGLSQFIEIVDVHVAYEKKVNGEVDYYGIFGVDPLADEEVLRRQYKKRALSLHPDKNKSVGADGAFQIISEAWSVLSNKEKRHEYDLKVNVRASNQTSRFSSPSTWYTTPATNLHHEFTRPSTPGCPATQPCPTASHPFTNTAAQTNFQHPPSHQWNPQFTPATFHPGSSTVGTSTIRKAAAGSKYDPSPQPPLNPTHGTSNVNFTAYQRTPAMSAQGPTIPVPPHPRNPTPRAGNQGSSSRNPRLVPRHRKIPSPAVGAQNHPAPTSSTVPSRLDTFWTLCNRCRVHYEYQKIYLNQNLLCPRCQHSFLAIEVPVPNANSYSSGPSPNPHQQQNTAAASSGFTSMPPPSTKTFCAASCQPSSEHSKRRPEMDGNMAGDNDQLMKNSCGVPENVETASASYPVSGGLNREKQVKKRRRDGQKCDGSKNVRQRTAGSSDVKRTSVHGKGNFGEERQSRSVKELSQSETRVMLMAKAKAEILHQLNKWESKKSDSSHLKKVETRDSQDALKNDSVNHPRTYSGRDNLFNDSNNTLQPRSSPPLKETDLEAPDEFKSMVVPDANFHNFDEDRVEESFTQGQVWAAYDDDDGMPRYYALVHNVISRSPFKMQISWLNSKSCSEFGSLDWTASGFTKTTGDFRIGKIVDNKRLNSFSHPVKWKKGARGAIQILPTKGDVWALYSNWSPNWNETTTDETIHKYDLVVVLKDYSKDIGVLVAPLEKVTGFTSVFNQLLDQTDFRTIPREEMFRFSHQIPFHMLNGLEAENAPKDCYELDPAALPLELLKVNADDESAERCVSRQPVHECGVMDEQGVKDEERIKVEDVKCLLKYSRRTKGGDRSAFFQSQWRAHSDTLGNNVYQDYPGMRKVELDGNYTSVEVLPESYQHSPFSHW